MNKCVKLFYNFLCKQYLTYRMMNGKMENFIFFPAANARFHFLKQYFKSQILVARLRDTLLWYYDHSF